MTRTFESYCDEFGHSEDPTKKYMGIAGLLGWSDHWRRFSEEWEACLKNEGIPRPFHMVDFIHHSEKFSDARWKDQQERLRVLNILLELVERAEPIPVAAAVSLKDYNALTVEEQRMCRGPYYLAFQTVTSNLGFAVGSKDLAIKVERARADMEADKKGLPVKEWDYTIPAKVSMVYAKFRGFTGPAAELWNALKSVNMFGYWMASYAIGEPSDCPPLQAADIWAYSIGNCGERRAAANPEAAIALKVFIRLAMKAQHGHHWFTHLDREHILGRIRPEVTASASH